MIDRRERTGLVTVLAAGLLVVNTPAVGAGSCVSEAGPVGAAFEDCSGGQVFNLVPPCQAGTYNMADFLKAQAGQGFPPHTRDQEPLYADLLDVAPNLRDADISTFYKDASFLADLSQAERVETFPLHPGTVIIRDKQFGVPHIFGATRADTEFGSGFASAEDRLFEMDVLRRVRRLQRERAAAAGRRFRRSASRPHRHRWGADDRRAADRRRRPGLRRRGQRVRRRGAGGPHEDARRVRAAADPAPALEGDRH